MKIGIEVNGVLRDTIEKITQVYQKNLIDEYENEYVNQTYNLDISGNTELNQTETLPFKYETNLPVNSLELSNHFKFQNKDEEYSFLFEEYVMEIFGHAPSSEMTTFNDFNDFYLNNREDNDIVIISDEMGKSKPATLFFLSKFGCLVESVIFYNPVTKNKILGEFDLIVTSNPDIIINYSNKIIVKYETSYNKHIESEYLIKNLKELEEITKKIKNA
jgi:hypothetical protein